ncbi:MAG: anhydro-N-acetylmuramic acid kinase [bacterium]
METKRVIGLMSGTSLDGIDASLVEINGCGLETETKLIAFNTYPYSSEVRKKILECCSPVTGTVDKVCYLNFLLGELFAEACIKITREAKLSLQDIDLIGSHGQTIYHQPMPKPGDGYHLKSTLQIGEPSVIVERTGIATVSDFRSRDVAAGGEGAPLTPYMHYLVFGNKNHNNKNRLIINIGGIANFTLLPSCAEVSDIIGFDTGPGNIVIDGVTRRVTEWQKLFDTDGKLASEGSLNEELLSELMKHPYLSLQPPKTTGREEFGEDYVEKLIQKAKVMNILDLDLVHTVTAFTVECILHHYKIYIQLQSQIDEVIIGGGGIMNKTLMEMLKRGFDPVPIYTFDDFNIPSKAFESVSFAILANETINGVPANLPKVTGARKAVVLGKIVEP